MFITSNARIRTSGNSSLARAITFITNTKSSLPANSNGVVFPEVYACQNGPAFWKVASHFLSNSIKLCYLSNGEGCLSVDKPHKGRVYRYYKIKVSAYSLKEEKMVEINARGYDAIVLQHEIDHLHGILFYDHIDKIDPFKNIPGSIEI